MDNRIIYCLYHHITETEGQFGIIKNNLLKNLICYKKTSYLNKDQLLK